MKKNRQPVAYWVNVFLFIAVILGLWWMCIKNIEPYHIAVKQLFGIGQEPIQVIELLNFKFQFLISWMVALIFWAILQGFQIAYLLITQSEKALGFLIQRAARSAKYAETENDDYPLRAAKRRYNSLPLQVLTYLKLACIFAYVVEFFVNTNAFPLAEGGMWGLLVAIAVDWSRLDVGNLAMILLTLFAVEGLVFAGLMLYRILEVFSLSGAYQK